MAKRVVVGMSGGVDSSVAALLLLEQGYEVIGVTMQIWQKETEEALEENGGCCGLSAVEDARRVAAQLGIPYYVMNFRREFETSVMDYFAREYCQGRTPNPCIACNRYVKWEALLQRSLKIGADYIATGHYAQIKQLPNGRYTLASAVTAAKDQTYALYSLTQQQLAHTLMPVGLYHKEEIRDMAAKRGLRVAGKPDSQEICFVPDKDYVGFIKREYHIKEEPGNFVSRDGRILGEHKGILHYTIGQRKGLGIAFGKPMFVAEIRPESREIVLAEDKELYTKVVYANHLNFMSMERIQGTKEANGKIRYNHQGAPCVVEQVEKDVIRCEFLEPQRAVTPGQALVLYDGDYVLGGGTIFV
ncbi:MAG: tRNA 2-thiouridine(34) synthase MnmA [Lachnospiraceae bacterium]|jgi:tRNA-specific 2-thiouridylase|nr:tRNA 2-thiouridine(34) synthase MnmA [Lachnospiraceae bacterium]